MNGVIVFVTGFERSCMGKKWHI